MAATAPAKTTRSNPTWCIAYFLYSRKKAPTMITAEEKKYKSAHFQKQHMEGAITELQKTDALSEIRRKILPVPSWLTAQFAESRSGAGAQYSSQRSGRLCIVHDHTAIVTPRRLATAAARVTKDESARYGPSTLDPKPPGLASGI